MSSEMLPGRLSSDARTAVQWKTLRFIGASIVFGDIFRPTNPAVNNLGLAMFENKVVQKNKSSVDSHCKKNGNRCRLNPMS